METIPETRSKYLALSITFGIHSLLILAFLLMGFVSPNENKPIMETTSGELGMFGFELVELNDLVLNSKASTSPKLIADPNEDNIKMQHGNSSVNLDSNDSEANSEYENVLIKWKQLKNKKTKKGNSKGSGLKEGNSLLSVSGGIENDSPFVLSNRSLVVKPETILNDSEEGKVVVEIVVNENGNVIIAIPGQRGSTTTSTALYKKAVKSAFTAKFNPSPDEIKEQRGTYTFVFTLE